MRLRIEHLLKPFKEKNKGYYTLMLILLTFVALRLFSCLFLPPPPPRPLPPTPTPLPSPTPTLDQHSLELQQLWGNVYGPTPINTVPPPHNPYLSQLENLENDLDRDKKWGQDNFSRPEIIDEILCNTALFSSTIVSKWTLCLFDT